MIACGLDFGTSNSAIGVARNRATALAPLEGSNTLMPSAVFFDYETKGRVLFGSDAISAYVGQTEGRPLNQALKRTGQLHLLFGALFALALWLG